LTEIDEQSLYTESLTLNKETSFTEAFTTIISEGIEFWIVIGLIAIFIIIGLRFRGKCPKCGQYRAFKKTGATRKDDDKTFGITYYEHRCTQCDFSDWLEQRSDGGGDGGG